MNGYNYFSGKEDMFTVDNYDPLLGQSQRARKGFSESIVWTQNKTGGLSYLWHHCLVIALRVWISYGNKTKLQFAGGNQLPVITNTTADAYGFVIRWQGVQVRKPSGNCFRKAYGYGWQSFIWSKQAKLWRRIFDYYKKREMKKQALH